MASTDPKRLFDVEGMVVVITGGATGIGLMMTKAFALNGAHKVYIVGRRKEKLDEAVKLSPSNIIPLVGDVTSKPDLVRLGAQIKQETGHINLLICNSGVMPPSIAVKASTSTPIADFAKAALEQDPEDWNRAFATNSTSVAYTTFAFLELLHAGNTQNNAPGRTSQILVTASIAGYLRVPGNNLPYAASKAAATHLAKHLSGYLAPYEIRVNGLAPGLFPSDLADGLIQGLGVSGDASVDGSVDGSVIPARRTGREEDMAGMVLFLASKAGAYVNGNIMVIDGGRMGLLPGTY